MSTTMRVTAADQSGARMTRMAMRSIFEACRAQRESETARREWIARQVREVAQELGAIPGEEDGVWELACPHCGQITYISETKGCAFVRASARKNCAATALIAQRVRDVL
jgi:hypothetical protein